MNSELKRAIYRKKMLYNKFQKYNNSKNWEAYRRQRNYATKLKSKSMNTYFIERCAGGPKSKDFWPTAKPVLTNKGIVNKKDTVLSENDDLITKQDDIDKFTISVSGLTIIGFAKWSSLGEIPSIPVAFFTFILLIRFSTKSGFIEEKEKLFSSNSGWLFFISKILGWSPSTFI
jgi:hypothetical protein